MARNPSWLPDAQCARRAAVGSVLSQIDMSFGDTPFTLKPPPSVFFHPGRRNSIMSGDRTTKLNCPEGLQCFYPARAGDLPRTAA